MMSRSDDRWLAADEWMSEYLEGLASNPHRTRKLHAEARGMVPAEAVADREYDIETDNLTRFLRGAEHERQAA